MVDSSWNQETLPPPRKGLPTGAKIVLGCGVACLLFFGGCVVLVGLGMKKGTEAFDTAWADLHADLRQLRTEEGTRALYAANPRLANRYPTVEDFLKAAAAWRPRLDEVPERRPDFKTMMATHGAMQFHRSVENGVRRTRVRYPLPKGGTLRFESENDRLVDISLD